MKIKVQPRTDGVPGWKTDISVEHQGVKQRTAHRLLLLKIKADLNAADAGLVKAEEAFLPWIVDSNGNTISDIVLPKIKAGYLALPARTGGDDAGGGT